MKVKTTEAYKKHKVSDKLLKCIPEAGIEMEISEERYKILHGENKYKDVFVELVEEKEVVEVAKKKPKTEKAVKKTTKKSK